MKQEIRIFFTALMFYTRIPCPSTTDHSPDYLNKATRYFPLIGWIVGGISAIFFYIGAWLFSLEIGVIFSLAGGVIVTGAFHEDGFADTFDGFGGGWNKKQILEIMKDSRIGTYGVIAIIALFSLKFYSLHGLLSRIEDTRNEVFILLIFTTYHALARLTAANVIFTTSYAREDETSKMKPIAMAYTYKEIMGAYICGLLPLLSLCLFFNLLFVWAIFPLVVLFYLAKRYFQKWIGGYTGDCLGAVEQMAECITLLVFFVLWKYM